MQRCVLKGEVNEVPVDVTEVRVIPQRYEHGCRLPAHGTITVDARSDDAWLALLQLAYSHAVVVLQRPDGGALELRLGRIAATRSTKRPDGSTARATVTFSWNAP